MAKLFYQGHGSYRITSNDGRVIYIDPYAGDKDSYFNHRALKNRE